MNDREGQLDSMEWECSFPQLILPERMSFPRFPFL